MPSNLLNLNATITNFVVSPFEIFSLDILWNYNVSVSVYAAKKKSLISDNENFNGVLNNSIFPHLSAGRLMFQVIAKCFRSCM